MLLRLEPLEKRLDGLEPAGLGASGFGGGVRTGTHTARADESQEGHELNAKEVCVRRICTESSNAVGIQAGRLSAS